MVLCAALVPIHAAATSVISMRTVSRGDSVGVPLVFAFLAISKCVCLILSAVEYFKDFITHSALFCLVVWFILFLALLKANDSNRFLKRYF